MSTDERHQETRAYYDDFAAGYDRERNHGYHLFLDELEFSVARPYLEDKVVLEAGCGTGLLLGRAQQAARRAVGVDLSPGMLEKARQRGLEVRQADLASLPFDDHSFDTVYSFKVLAHIHDIARALNELDRVTRPGGHLVLEFYNRRSLRALVKAVKRPGRISGQRTENDVYTRFDTLEEIRAMAPSGWQVQQVRGARVWTTLTGVYDWPVAAPLMRGLERLSSHGPMGRLGGFLIVVFGK